MNSKKLVSAALTATTVLWMVGAAALVPVASAQSTSSLQAQIAALLAQIQTLQSQLNASGGSASMTYDFTSDLTVGSTGSQVSSLQQLLISKGYLTAVSAPTGYFGALTAAALGKFQAANGITPSVGYFGPKTRAFVNSMSSGTTGSGSSTVMVATGAPMSVAIDPSSPASTNVANGAVNTPVLKLDFTAGATPVTVTNLVLNRMGLSQDSDLDNVYLYENGSKLASDLGFNQGAITFSNGAGLFTVPADSTAVITVSVDVDPSTSNSGHIFEIGLESATDVTGGTFTGNFPLNGAQMTIATVSNLATLTISGDSSSTINVNAGQTGELVGQFTLTAGNNAVDVNALNFTVVGSIPNGGVQNVKLMDGSTQLGNTISSLNTGNDVAQFNLSGAPLMLTSGQSVVLSLYADVSSGVNRYFQFSLQQTSDVQAKDMIYGVGIGASYHTAGNTGGFPVEFYYVNINNGGLVITKDAATPTTNVVAGNTNQVLAKFDVLASGDSVKFNKLTFLIQGANAAVNNFRVVDDQGAQIGTTINTSATSTYTTINGYANATSVAEGSGSLNYIIPANTTRVLTVYGDLPSGDTGTVTVLLNGDNTSAAQSYTTYQATTVSTVGGNQLTIQLSSSNLSAAQNYSLGTVSGPAGATGVKIGSYTFTAGQVNAVNLTGLSIETATSTGDATNLRNLRAEYGTTQIGTTYATVASGTVYNFNSSAPIAIAANGSVTIDLYADINSSILTGQTSGGLTTLTAVNANTASGNAVTVSSVTGQNVNFNNGGVLTGALSAGTSQSAYIGMNVPGVNLAQFQFSADNNGGETITQLNLTDASSVTNGTTFVTSTKPSDFINYRLTDTSGNTLGTATEGSNGALQFNLTGLTVPVNSTAYVNLVADSNSYPNATSGDNHRYVMTSYQYTNASQSNTTSTTSNNFGNTFTIYQTTLNVTGASFSNPSSINAAGNIVGEFTFAAGSGSINPIVKTVTLYTAGTLIGTSTSQVLGLYDAAAPSVPLATSTLSSTTPAIFAMGSVNANQWAIPASGSKTLLVKTFTPGSNFVTFTSGNSGSYQVLLNGVQWSDGTTGTGSTNNATTTNNSASSTWIQTLSPSISIPVASQNITGVSN